MCNEKLKISISSCIFLQVILIDENIIFLKNGEKKVIQKTGKKSVKSCSKPRRWKQSSLKSILTQNQDYSNMSERKCILSCRVKLNIPSVRRTINSPNGISFDINQNSYTMPRTTVQKKSSNDRCNAIKFHVKYGLTHRSTDNHH